MQFAIEEQWHAYYEDVRSTKYQTLTNSLTNAIEKLYADQVADTNTDSIRAKVIKIA